MLPLLMVLQELGTMDHAVALKSQFEQAGGQVRIAVLGRRQELPEWAQLHFENSQFVRPEIALQNMKSFSAVWLQNLYEELRPAEWRNLWTRAPLVYSGYGVHLAEWDEGHFQISMQRNVSLVLASNQEEQRKYLESPFPPGDCLLTGDPFMFTVRETGVDRGGTRENNYLWAPHWTPSWPGKPQGFANWQWSVKPLFLFFKERPHERLVVRPHPFMKPELGSWSARYYYRRLLELPNVERSKASLLQDILASRVLLSDGVSILAYFGATGKPVVFLENPKSPSPFSEQGRQLLSSAVSVGTSRELFRVLGQFAERADIVFSENYQLRSASEELFPAFEASPGALLLNRIRAGL